MTQPPPTISGRVLAAWRGAHNRTLRDLERAGRGWATSALTQAETAGLQAAIAAWVQERADEVPPTQGSGHDYLSTACAHVRHGDCRIACKFCGNCCRCACHTPGPGSAATEPE